MNELPPSALLLGFGGAIFAWLGAVHAAFTFMDARRPSRLVPEDPAVIQAMAGTGVRLARGGTTMWRAWLGFNLSHSLGAIIFGGAVLMVGWQWQVLLPPRRLLLIPVAIGLFYLGLSLRYWFRVPTAGIALATASFAAAWLLAP